MGVQGISLGSAFARFILYTSLLTAGMVLLAGDAKAASQIWVAGTAYDEVGRVVGVRRWESSVGFSAGGSLPFEFMISSIGGEIARVEFAVEARP